MANKLETRRYHFLYKTTNLINGKYYIGMHSTNNLEDGYLGSGKYLKRSIKKHNKKNFKIEILEFVNSREELVKREEEIVTLSEIVKEFCMNLKSGGRGGTSPAKIIATKKYFKSLRDNLEIKLIHSKKVKEGLKKVNFNHKTFKDKKHTKETKLKQSLAKKGKGLGIENSQYGTCWIYNETGNKKVKKKEVSEYVNRGWCLGRGKGNKNNEY